MEKNHAMTIRKIIATSLLTMLTTAMVMLAPLSGAISVNVDVSTDSNSDLDDEACEEYQSGLSAIIGCDDADKVLDFTEYTGEFKGPDASGYDDALTQSQDARSFIQTMVNFALSFLGIVATVVIIYGGIMYVMSRGDEEMATKGKKSIAYAAVGIVIILGSFALANTLIGAGGGRTDGGLGGGSGGTTILDSGADFDVDGVLAQLEDTLEGYIDAYKTYIDAAREVEYIRSLEMPFIIVVESAEYGFWDSFIEGEAWDNDGAGDKGTDYFVDGDWVRDYAAELQRGATDVQGIVDPLSSVYEYAQILYDYLRSGSSVYGTLGYVDHHYKSWLIARAQAYAADETEILEALYGHFMDTYHGGSCAEPVDAYEATYTDEEGLFANTVLNSDRNDDKYTFKLYPLDYNVCDYIDDISTYLGEDYSEQVDELIEEFLVLKGLFDTEGLDTTSGSTLSRVYALFQAVVDSDTELSKDGCTYYGGALGSAKCIISSATVREVVNTIDDLYAAVQNLEFVKVALTASATKGNAPLIVEFNALGTEDPGGNTVEEDQIYWDLDGDGEFAEENGDDGAGTGTAVSRVYNKEGTYRVKVRVVSQEDDIAAGLAMVTLRVEPPESSIVISASVSGEPSVIADFREFPEIDKSFFKVTSVEAEEGITFDASETTDGDESTGAEGGIVKYTWSMGDSNTISGGYADAAVVKDYQYAEGTYTVSLTVMDSTGEEDRKYFTLYVGSPAARISYNTLIGEVGDTFKFDGTSSSSDIGNIVSYQWKVEHETLGELTDLASTSSSLSVNLDNPGYYTVTLRVADSTGKTDTNNVDVLVESQTPVASFTYSVPNEHEPATVEFDASDTYDPDKGDTVSIEWEFEGISGQDYKIIDGDSESEELTVQFIEIGDYDVSLTACDQHKDELQKCDTVTKTLEIDSILDVNLDINGNNARHLDDDGEAEVDFTAGSKVASGFEINYGDGSTDFTETIKNGKASFTHIYNESGVFYVTLTAYDDDDNTNSIIRRIYIADGDSPIAVMNVTADGEDIGFGSSLSGNVNTKFTFDATDSVNVDGSGGNLSYSWNFGDGTTSSQSKVTHTYDEHATYTVLLTVKDKTNKTLTDETTLEITIEGLRPQIRGISVVPQGDSLETPLKVGLDVDAIDGDGSITYVKAWYYDLENSAKELGTVVAQSTDITITINTKGEEGEQVEYGFAVEVTDNDNNTVSSVDELTDDETPTLKVTNGPNDNPVANFSVDRSSVYIGDEVTFSSTSYDTDGEIVSYWWDVEGDGFFNNEATTETTYTYTFKQVHSEGVEVQLKVEDDIGATATSETVIIYVDANSDPPDAAFLTDVAGTKVQFYNTSTVDEENGAELAELYWDFDLGVDSDGNGVSDDDVDSYEEDPVYDYDTLDVYEVSLTVVDNTGQSDTITKELSIVDADAPVADFSYTVDGKEVTFKNSSSADSKNGLTLRSYSWDFGIGSSSADSTEKNPSYAFEDYGTYEVTLTVEDELGHNNSVTKDVTVSDPSQTITANFTSVPQPNSRKQIIMTGSSGDVTFYFSAETDSKDVSYTIDKNIFYDTDGDGIRDNDKDYEATEPGSWKTAFDESYGQIVTKLTVKDNETGNKDVETLQVVFEGTLGSANLFNATPREMIFFILTALLAVFAGTALVFNYKPIKS